MRKCPCCNSKINPLVFFNQKNIRCTKCKKVIGTEKKYSYFLLSVELSGLMFIVYINNIVLLLFKIKTEINYMEAFIFVILFSIFITYYFFPLKCENNTNPH